LNIGNPVVEDEDFDKEIEEELRKQYHHSEQVKLFLELMFMPFKESRKKEKENPAPKESKQFKEKKPIMLPKELRELQMSKEKKS